MLPRTPASAAPRLLLLADAQPRSALRRALSQALPHAVLELQPHPLDAVFRLCAGDWSVAVVDAAHVGPTAEMQLRQVRRAAPRTAIVAFADEPARPAFAPLAEALWLRFVATSEVVDTVREIVGRAAAPERAA